MHILVFDGIPIAAAERLERLSLVMAAYTPNQQALMAINAVEVYE